MAQEPNSPQGTVQTVSKALALLELFTTDVEWLGVREIGRILDINNATVHNLLRTLASSGFVEQHPETRKYRLGLALVRLAGTKLAQLDLVKVCSPHMKALMEKTGETVTLSVLHGSELLYLAKNESTEPMRVASRVGGSAPLHCSANGKALLAFIEEPQLSQFFSQPLKRFTSETIVDSEIVRAELQDIRRLGYAVDLGGYLPGVNAVGAPIRDQTHKVVASLGIVGPASRLKEEKLTFCTIHVQEAAAEMSRLLGWNRR